jgi:hypothetical protein
MLLAVAGNCLCSVVSFPREEQSPATATPQYLKDGILSYFPL